MNRLGSYMMELVTYGAYINQPNQECLATVSIFKTKKLKKPDIEL